MLPTPAERDPDGFSLFFLFFLPEPPKAPDFACFRRSLVKDILCEWRTFPPVSPHTKARLWVQRSVFEVALPTGTAQVALDLARLRLVTVRRLLFEPIHRCFSLVLVGLQLPASPASHSSPCLPGQVHGGKPHGAAMPLLRPIREIPLPRSRAEQRGGWAAAGLRLCGQPRRDGTEPQILPH